MQSQPSLERQFNHKAMRRFVGITAIVLWPTVMVLSGRSGDLTSISISYWTDARDVFIGALFAIGFFLFAYNGAGGRRAWEYGLSKAACLFSVCIALFPTDGFPMEASPVASWVGWVAGLFGVATRSIHFASAVLLFVCLIGLMVIFSFRARSKGKATRSRFYMIVAILMGCGIVIGYPMGKCVFHAEKTVLYVEIWCLTLFGAGWLRAGLYKNEGQ